MKTPKLGVTALTMFAMVAVSEAQMRYEYQNQQIQERDRQRRQEEAHHDAVRRGVQQAIEANRAQLERERAKEEQDRISRMSDGEKMKLRRTRTDECNARYAPSERPACFDEMRSVGLEPLR